MRNKEVEREMSREVEKEKSREVEWEPASSYVGRKRRRRPNEDLG